MLISRPDFSKPVDELRQHIWGIPRDVDLAIRLPLLVRGNDLHRYDFALAKCGLTADQYKCVFDIQNEMFSQQVQNMEKICFAHNITKHAFMHLFRKCLVFQWFAFLPRNHLDHTYPFFSLESLVRYHNIRFGKNTPLTGEYFDMLAYFSHFSDEDILQLGFAF